MNSEIFQTKLLDSAIILSQHGCMQTVGKVWRARYLIGRDYHVLNE